MNPRLAAPLVFTAFASGLNGIDFLLHHNLAVAFTYYGRLPAHVADGIVGLIGVAAAALVLIGVMVGGERSIRIGLVLAFASYVLVAIGLLLHGTFLIIDPSFHQHHADRSTVASVAVVAGCNYLMLSMLLLLAGLRTWSGQVHP